MIKKYIKCRWKKYGPRKKYDLNFKGWDAIDNICKKLNIEWNSYDLEENRGRIYGKNVTVILEDETNIVVLLHDNQEIKFDNEYFKEVY